MSKLTKRFVESAKVKTKQYFIFDDTISGFSVCISPNGKRHYCFQYTKNKRIKRMWLGQHGPMTAEQARAEALTKLSEVKAGGDPHKKKVEKELEPLMQDVAERFMTEHATTYCKPRTQRDYRNYLNSYILPVLKNLKISEITRADVASLHHSISVERTRDIANRCVKVLSKIFNLSEIWGLRTEGSNPCRHIKKFPTKARDRYLSQEETQRLGQVLDEIKTHQSDNIAALYCIQLLLLTGCRLSEIRTLKWEYIDYEGKLLKLPDSKTGPKTIYAGRIVIDLLLEIKHNPNRPKDNHYVIWGSKPNSCLINVQKPWKRFCKLAGLDGVRIHDLRHSFISFAAKKGANDTMARKLLGHKHTQTTARYVHLDAQPVIEVAENVTTDLSRLLKIENVTNTQTQSTQQNEIASNFSNVSGNTVKGSIYLSSEQAAEHLNVKQSLLEYWRYKKTGPAFVKVGSRIRYRLDALEAFVQNNQAIA